MVNIDIPDTLEISPGGDAIFKVMIGDKRVTVRMYKSQNISDFLDEIKKYCGLELTVSRDGREIYPDSKIGEIAKKVGLS